MIDKFLTKTGSSTFKGIRPTFNFQKAKSQDFMSTASPPKAPANFPETIPQVIPVLDEIHLTPGGNYVPALVENQDEM